MAKMYLPKSLHVSCKKLTSTKVRAGETAQQSSPFEHKLVLANYHIVDDALVTKAIESALRAKRTWAKTSLHDRAAIFYRAASLLQDEYKHEMMAATILGQGKNPYQADIDCVAEVSFPFGSHSLH
jgi:1-pyrroline-5-carboxylate dehydrogenase